MTLQFLANLEGLLIYRLGYQRLKRKDPAEFKFSLAQILLTAVNVELDIRLEQIDISEALEILKTD